MRNMSKKYVKRHFCIAENTVHVHYKDQWLNFVRFMIIISCENHKKHKNTLFFKRRSVLVLRQLVHIFTTTTFYNSGMCHLAVLIVIAHIDVTYRIELTFCAFTPIYRSVQKPVQLLRWANSPHDCSHSAVRNSPRDQLPPTEWVLQFRDSNIKSLRRKFKGSNISASCPCWCDLWHCPPPPSPPVRESLRLHVHSNAHKVIAGFFLSPDPEVT
jgi:hypothetical protein